MVSAISTKMNHKRKQLLEFSLATPVLPWPGTGTRFPLHNDSRSAEYVSGRRAVCAAYGWRNLFVVPSLLSHMFGLQIFLQHRPGVLEGYFSRCCKHLLKWSKVQFTDVYLKYRKYKAQKYHFYVQLTFYFGKHTNPYFSFIFYVCWWFNLERGNQRPERSYGN